MTTWRGCTEITLLLAIVAFCLFGYTLGRYGGIFCEFQAALVSLQWMLLFCIAIWCGSFIFLMFSLKDLPLIVLLLIAIAVFFVGYATSSRAVDAVILLAGVTLGKSAFVLLRRDEGENDAAHVTRHSPLVTFLVGLVVLLAFSSCWHLDMSNNFYHGPRWMGLWDNPNIYGMLMGAGVVLAAGLLAERLKAKGEMLNEEKRKEEMERRKLFQILKAKTRKQKLLIGFLLVAALMMGVGLVMSYSRGAWVGAAIGLLYLAKAYGKFKWRWVLPPVLVTALVVCFFWNNTPGNAPWYLKRLDLSRASAQHRVAAWKAGFEMMRDHPFGVGWNKAVSIYQKDYSPPEGSAAAITTNDYLMLGTQLGVPGLACFIAYAALCLRRNRPHLTLTLSPPAGSREGIKIACRAGALAMLVAFWFDGGLFKLATASVFWILLELGSERQKLKTETGRQFRHLTPALSPDEAERESKSEMDQSLVTSAATK